MVLRLLDQIARAINRLIKRRLTLHGDGAYRESQRR